MENPFAQGLMTGTRIGSGIRSAETDRLLSGPMSSGDYAGAAQIATKRGAFDTAQSLQRAGADAEATQKRQTIEDAIKKGDVVGAYQFAGADKELLAGLDAYTKHTNEVNMTLGRTLVAVEKLPYEQRRAAIEAQLPRLEAAGISPEMVASFDPSDQNIGVLRNTLLSLDDQLRQARPQFFNTTAGVVAVDPQTAEAKLAYAAPPRVPAGFQEGEDGRLAPIPGGPADPAYRGQVAGATRAPRRSGSGNGGGGMKLPAGFVLDGN